MSDYTLGIQELDEAITFIAGKFCESDTYKLLNRVINSFGI